MKQTKLDKLMKTIAQNAASVSGTRSGRELLIFWKVSLVIIVMFPILTPLGSYVADLLWVRLGDAASVLVHILNICLMIEGLAFVLSLFGVLLSVPLSYTVSDECVDLARIAWLVTMGVCLMIVVCLTIWESPIMGRPGDYEGVAVYALSIALLSFPVSLMVWLSNDDRAYYFIGFVPVLGYLQWFVVIPALISWFRRQKQNHSSGRRGQST